MDVTMSTTKYLEHKLMAVQCTMERRMGDITL